VWAMKRGDGRAGDGRRVGNGLDRGHVGVVIEECWYRRPSK